jgi:hypothetical protein
MGIADGKHDCRAIITVGATRYEVRDDEGADGITLR